MDHPLVNVIMNVSPSPSCAVYRNWSRVALLYTGSRDGDGSGSATFHLQHLLLQKDIDCLTRKMPAIYKNVSRTYTVNIYMYKTIQARVNTVEIPTTGIYPTLYQELLQPLWVIYQ